jgi:phosphoribosylformylglycinamidine synthase
MTDNAKASALILTGYGINCDLETARAFELAGARAARVHLNDLIAEPAMLERFHLFAVPGGFSFGDDIASGRVLANRLRYRLGDALARFVDDGKLAIGICNGFQVLVKMGLLPRMNGSLTQQATLSWNDSGRFEDRWVRLAADKDTKCVWLRGVRRLELPVRHGEGKFMGPDGFGVDLAARGQVALRYAATDWGLAGGQYPANPNGSDGDIAGICDPTGRVFGLMPHPEAFVHRTNHPRWTREAFPEEGAGLQVFRSGVAYAEETLPG